MHPALYAIRLGVLVSLAAWIWFRLPGQPFWAAAPVWHAFSQLTPAGARLWIGGTLISLAGGLWLVSHVLMRAIA